MKKHRKTDTAPEQPYVAPMGFLIADFNLLRVKFKEELQREKRRKPSAEVYKQISARPVYRKVSCKNETFAGQMIVLCAENGISAQRLGNPKKVEIAYYKNIIESVDWLVKTFRDYDLVITSDSPKTTEEALDTEEGV